MNNYPCFQNVSLSLLFYSFFSVCSWSVSFPSGPSFKIWMLFSFQVLLSFYILPDLCNLDLRGSEISICGLNLFIKFQVHICNYTLNISTSTSHRLHSLKCTTSPRKSTLFVQFIWQVILLALRAQSGHIRSLSTLLKRPYGEALKPHAEGGGPQALPSSPPHQSTGHMNEDILGPQTKPAKHH